jgi:hypothetical protein
VAGIRKPTWPAGLAFSVVAIAGATLSLALSPVTAATSASPSTVMRQLDALAGRRVQLTAAIAKDHARADTLAGAVRAGNLRARRDRVDRRRSRGQLAALLVEQYKSSSSDSTAFLLAARSLSDLISRSETLDRLSADQAAVIAAVATDEGRVRRDLVAIGRARRAVATKLAAVTSARASIDDSIAAQRQLLARLTAPTLRAVQHEQSRRQTLAHDSGTGSQPGGGGSGQAGGGTGHTFTGEVTWYGPGFAGRPTASGEPFDPNKLTAASPWLPFGTMLRVTSLVTHKSVTVRVNDRGPFGRGVLDLSEHAASVIDLSGWQQCRLEVVG